MFLLMPLLHKIDKCIVNFLRVRGTQEMLSILDSDKLSIRRIDEKLNLLLRVGD